MAASDASMRPLALLSTSLIVGPLPAIRNPENPFCSMMSATRTIAFDYVATPEELTPPPAAVPVTAADLATALARDGW